MSTCTPYVHLFHGAWHSGSGPSRQLCDANNAKLPWRGCNAMASELVTGDIETDLFSSLDLKDPSHSPWIITPCTPKHSGCVIYWIDRPHDFKHHHLFSPELCQHGSPHHAYAPHKQKPGSMNPFQVPFPSKQTNCKLPHLPRLRNKHVSDNCWTCWKWHALDPVRPCVITQVSWHMQRNMDQ